MTLVIKLAKKCWCRKCISLEQLLSLKQSAYGSMKNVTVKRVTFMKRFSIKWEMPGIGGAPKNDLNNAGKDSEGVLESLRADGQISNKSRVASLATQFFASTQLKVRT